MGLATWVFLIIGGVGVVTLAVALLGAEVLHFGHPDIDGPVSTEAIAAFVGAFGFAAAIASELLGAGAATATGAGLAGAAGIGALAALPAAYLTVRLSRAARRMATDATPTRADLVGTIGVVVTPIPVTGYGEVRIRLGGQPVKLNARAAEAIPAGAQIFVIEAPSDTSVVVEPTPPLT
jgi:membrane protein implicated in regulation of membrane protease activity